MKTIFVSVNIELLSEIYPEWDQQMHPLMVIAIVVTGIALFTLISYLHIYFSAKNESKLETAEPKYECDYCGGTFDELTEFCPHCGIEFDEIETTTDLNEFEGKPSQMQ